MKAEQIEAFFMKLTAEEALAAVVEGLGLLSHGQVVDALTQALTNDDLDEVASRIADHLAENGPTSDDEDTDA